MVSLNRELSFKKPFCEEKESVISRTLYISLKRDVLEKEVPIEKEILIVLRKNMKQHTAIEARILKGKLYILEVPSYNKYIYNFRHHIPKEKVFKKVHAQSPPLSFSFPHVELAWITKCQASQYHGVAWQVAKQSLTKHCPLADRSKEQICRNALMFFAICTESELISKFSNMFKVAQYSFCSMIILTVVVGIGASKLMLQPQEIICCFDEDVSCHIPGGSLGEGFNSCF